MTKPKSYTPVAARRRYCALEGCDKRIRISPGVGRPPRYCSDECRRKSESRRVAAILRQKDIEEREERRIQPTQAAVMRARGYLTVADAAGRAAVSKTAVYNWAARGLVESIRVGRAWYILAASLAKYLGPEAAKLLGSGK